MMVKIKEVPGRKTDPFLPLLLKGSHEGEHHVHGVKDKIMDEKQKDDALFMYAGKTGTGKSTLLLWSYDLYTPNQDILFVPRSEESFALALKEIKKLRVEDRALMYDEAEANKRNSMSKWNKDLIRLYSKIRGKRILHGWCYPDSDSIDKKLISNRVNGIFVTYEKNTTGYRHYYYYSQEGIKRILRDFKELSVDLLIEQAKKYAEYQGYFAEYDGPLRAAYFERKEQGMDDEIDSFSEKYGNDEQETFGLQATAKLLGVSLRTVERAVQFGYSTNVLDKNKITSLSGRYKLLTEDIELIRTIILGHGKAWAPDNSIGGVGGPAMNISKEGGLPNASPK